MDCFFKGGFPFHHSLPIWGLLTTERQTLTWDEEFSGNQKCQMQLINCNQLTIISSSQILHFISLGDGQNDRLDPKRYIFKPLLAFIRNGCCLTQVGRSSDLIGLCNACLPRRVSHADDDQSLKQ